MKFPSLSIICPSTAKDISVRLSEIKISLTQPFLIIVLNTTNLSQRLRDFSQSFPKVKKSANFFYHAQLVVFMIQKFNTDSSEHIDDLMSMKIYITISDFRRHPY